MNNEENKSKELRDSIDRMADELAKVIKTAQSAYDKIAHVELRDGSGAAWRMLSEAVCNLRHTLRPKPGTAAFLTEIIDYYCANEPRLRLMPENEKPDAAPEAGQKTPDPIAESVKRMQGVLDEVESNVRAARFLVSGMDSEQLKWAQLSRACGRIHDLTRLGWQKLTEKPEVFHSPKEIIDFVTANPPIGEVKDAPTPIDPSAPEMVNGGGYAAEDGRGSHEPSGGGAHPLPHGHFAQGRCQRCCRLADGRALAHETSLRQAAQPCDSPCEGRRDGGLVP